MALHETNAQLNQAHASHKELAARLEAEIESVQVFAHESCQAASGMTLEEMAQLMALPSARPALTATRITSMVSNPVDAVNSARQPRISSNTKKYTGAACCGMYHDSQMCH